jgi:hypothetical protein
MKAKRIVIISLLVIAALVLTGVAPLVWLAIAGPRTPVRVPTPDYWPTNGWQTSTPEEQGFDSAQLAAGLQALQEKDAQIFQFEAFDIGVCSRQMLFDGNRLEISLPEAGFMVACQAQNR